MLPINEDSPVNGLIKNPEHNFSSLQILLFSGRDMIGLPMGRPLIIPARFNFHFMPQQYLEGFELGNGYQFQRY